MLRKYDMKCVLIVDDIEEYLDTIEGFIEDDFKSFKARNLQEAKKIIERETVDIALVDIRLDEDDPENKEGLDLLKWIREKQPDLPVVVMSAYREFDYAVEALNLGAKYFIKKPVNPEELLRILKELT